MGEQVIEGGAAEAVEEIDSEQQRKLDMPVQELELSVRASNCLESAKIETVGELAALTEAELLKIRSFGKTSLREVKRKLADLGLSLGAGGGVNEDEFDDDALDDEDELEDDIEDEDEADE